MSVIYERKHILDLACEQCGAGYYDEIYQKLQTHDYLEDPSGKYWESPFSFLKNTARLAGWTFDSVNAYCKSCVNQSKMEP